MEALEDSERWLAVRFELSEENPSYFKKAKLLGLAALWSVLQSPPLLPIFVERQRSDMGRKSDIMLTRRNSNLGEHLPEASFIRIRILGSDERMLLGMHFFS